MASHRLLFLAACAALLLGACVQESRAWGTPAPPSESECRPYIEKALKEMEHHDETGPQDEADVSAESEQQAGGSAEDVVATAEGIDGTSLEEGQSTEATEGGDSTEEAGEPNEEAAQSTEETGGESAESEAGATTEGGESTEEAAAADASAEGSESTETAAEESGEAVAEGGESNEESAASTEAAAEGGESAEAAVEDSEPTEAATSAEEVAEGSQSAEGDESTEATAEGGESTEDAAAASGESTEAEALQADELTEAASESGESTEAGEQGEAAAGGESAEDAAAVSSESIEETATTEEGESSEAAGAGDESVEAAAISSESTEETTDAGSESAEAPAEGADAAEAPEEAAEGGESLESAEDAAASEGGDSAEANATESADGESTEAEAAASVESTEDATTSTESTEEAALEGESTVAAADESQSAENVSAEGQESGEATSAEATEASVESKESTENVGDQSSTEQEATSAEVALSAESAEQLETQTETAEELPEEDLTLAIEIPENLRPRDHISRVLKLDEESAESEVVWEKVADGALRELKRLYDTAIKPLEMLYKYRDLSNRHFGDPEIFSKPLILFMGPWSGGKSTIINYLLDNEYNQYSLRTGAEPSPAYFNILMHGERSEILDGTQLAADWTFSGLQKFGQGLLDRLRGVKLNSPLLEKVNIVEIPGILEIRKQVERMFPFNDACQWFIDRADIIFLVYDPSKLDVGPETEAILDQLKGREYQTRIILNKADQVKPEELMRVQGTLIWNISPLMSSAEPPIMYSTSLWSMPYESGAPVRLLQAQEHAFLRDLREAINKRVDNKIASARRFAVRVRNHAKMVDCYLTTYYNHKTFFGNKKKTADDIIEHPQEYHIYEGLSTLTNISRYDLPDPETYRDFFKLNPLYEFQQLAATCTYFRGCPINRLDVAIAYDLPELVGKYKKSAEDALEQYQKNLPKS